MGILKLNNTDSENVENSTASVQPVATAAEEKSSVPKASTVTVTTQIEVNTTDMLTFVTTESDEDTSDDFPNELRASYAGPGSTEVWSVIQIDTTKLPKANNIKAFLIELTSKSDATGKFSFADEWNDSVPNKKYQFDITEKVKTSEKVRFEINPDGGGCDIEFYTMGTYAPRVLAVVETEKEPDSVIYNLKDIPLGNKATAYVDLNGGTASAVVSLFSEKDFSVPLNLTQVYTADETNGVYGQNWRLNLEKNLKSKISTSYQKREFIFIDELGLQYDFKETYYYVRDGKKIAIDKNAVTVDVNGNLSYHGTTVFRHQSCNGYTLIPEIDGFINADLLEQRQTERIQIESYLNQIEPNLKTYCAVNIKTGDIYQSFNELTKTEYDEIIYFLSESLATVFMSQSEALQLKSLYNSLDQNKLQVKKLNVQLTDLENTQKLGKAIYPVSCEEEIDFELSVTEDTQSQQVAKIREQMAYKSAKANEELIKSPNELSLISEQEQFVKSQIAYIIKQAQANLENVKETFRQYFSKKSELEMLIKHTPVNFLKDENGIISGFNSEGNLVYICDGYGNYAAVQYDTFGKITSIYDSKKSIVNFEYTDDKLTSITDVRGRKINYRYDENKLNLTEIIYPDGDKISFGYVANGLHTLTYDSGETALLNYTGGKISGLTLSGLYGGQTREISSYGFVFGENNVSVSNSEGETEEYFFNEEKRATYSWKKSNTGVITSESITYDYTDGKKITTVKDSNLTPQSVTETEIYDGFDLLVSKEVDWQNLSDTVQVKTLTEYEYDLHNRPVFEKTTRTTKKDGVDKDVISVVKYGYNTHGDLILTESYVEGEELTSGKIYEERTYDEDGNLIKTVSWNSLDSSTKFYNESTYAENGQLAADKNELGEVTTEYEYLDGTNVVNGKTLANGGKIAYGRNPYNGVITSVTQSTEDGEANTTDIIYNGGIPVEVKSGNTVIEYTYDHKGRKTQVSVNGVKQIESAYEDYAQEGTRGAKFTKQTHTFHEDGTAITNVYLKTGVFNSAVQRMSCEETLTCGNDSLYVKKYNTEEQLTEVTYKNGAEGNAEVKYTYDSYRHMTKAETKYPDGTMLTENVTYTPYGEVASKTYTGALNQAYSYTYEDNSTRKLSEISFGDYKFKPLSDVNGRNTGKEIYNAETKVAGEYISYRKVGDHATNMLSTVCYASGKTVKDNVKYKYDKCGNIIEITENNRLAVRYEYDKLNRLVKEDNRQLGRVYEYVYDTNGNILNKFITENGETVTDKYEYEGDKLLTYNGEESTYNTLGNPVKYRNKALSWQYGKYLTKCGATTFAYDGLGRRASKDNIKFIYDNDGRLIAQSDGLQFIYDNAGVVGFIHNGTQYFYRKDVQGNIIAILDNTGKVVVKYLYDAWGNHAVVDIDGKNIENPEHIGNKNPFRYRGYYYDVETGLYYLQTRYYDPEVGRFISQDSVEFADPESINGLNLYAYCGNNPVMNVDPTGEFFLSFFVAVLAGALIGGITGGVSSVVKGEDFWGGFLSGALVGGVLGGALILGGATMLAIAGKAVFGFAVASTVAKVGLFIGTATTSVIASFGAGMGAYAIRERMNGREIDPSEMFRQGFNTGLKGGIAFVTGMTLATAGVYNYLIQGVKLSFKENFATMIIRSSVSFLLQFPWKMGLN